MCVDGYMRGICESIWNGGSEYAVFAFFVVNDYGSICVGDEKEGWRGWNPTDGCT